MDPSGTCRGRLRGPAAPLVEILPKEKMPVLKSEDLFECPAELLKPILTFLDLPNVNPKLGRGARRDATRRWIWLSSADWKNTSSRTTGGSTTSSARTSDGRGIDAGTPSLDPSCSPWREVLRPRRAAEASSARLLTNLRRRDFIRIEKSRTGGPVENLAGPIG
jgi:hypothetical protein